MKLIGFLLFLLLLAVFIAFGFMTTSDTYLINNNGTNYTAKVETWAQVTMAAIFAIFCFIVYSVKKRSKKLLLAWLASGTLSVMTTIALVNSEKHNRIEYYVFGVSAASISYDQGVKASEPTLLGKTTLSSGKDSIEIFTGICPLCVKVDDALSQEEQLEQTASSSLP